MGIKGYNWFGDRFRCGPPTWWCGTFAHLVIFVLVLHAV
jgi:hypothetical protein